MLDELIAEQKRTELIEQARYAAVDKREKNKPKVCPECGLVEKQNACSKCGQEKW